MTLMFRTGFFSKRDAANDYLHRAFCGGSGVGSLAGAPGKFRKERNFTE